MRVGPEADNEEENKIRSLKGPGRANARAVRRLYLVTGKLFQEVEKEKKKKKTRASLHSVSSRSLPSPPVFDGCLHLYPRLRITASLLAPFTVFDNHRPNSMVQEN